MFPILWQGLRSIKGQENCSSERKGQVKSRDQPHEKAGEWKCGRTTRVTHTQSIQGKDTTCTHLPVQLII